VAARRVGIPTDELRDLRRLGLAGSLLLAVGAFGAGALPTPNPMAGLRLVGLPARNPTISLAVAYAGLVLLVLAWGRVLLRLRRPGAPSRRALTRAAVTWILPLALAPPLFSRDVYSYVAQGAILARGLDPYRLGPAAALGISDPLVRSIPAIWRDTPAPYGPLSLLIGRDITALTGDDVVTGVLAYRAVALGGLALIAWALPRLARRAGADPDHALWLGAANPLVVFHFVSGAHNDALMIGLMLAGLAIGLSGRRSALVCGAVLIVAASAVKVPALLALAYLGLADAADRGGRPSDVLRATWLMTTIAVAIYTWLALATGVGLRWLTVLETPGSVVSFLSVTTDLGIATAALGVAVGLGAHLEADLALLHGVGVVAAVVLLVGTLHGCLRRHRDPLASLAVGMAAVAVLAVQTQPWYLLWALIPAAATTRPALHRALGWGCVVLAVLIPPTGGDFVFRGFQLTNALAAAALLVAAVLGMAHLPNRWPKAARLRRVPPVGGAIRPSPS
jgi:alpha-1,6-mannosyltransferase